MSRQQLPLFAAVFLGSLTVGLSLGVLPGYIRDTLHFNNFIVGLVIGLESVATLASRHFSGVVSDTRGSNVAVGYGVGLCALAGLVYVLSAVLTGSPLAGLLVLLVGRIILGIGESLLITGALSWGVGLSGPQHSGKVMAWTGIAIYGALACGTPLGMLLRENGGVIAVWWGVALFPLLGGVCLRRLQRVPVSGFHRVPFYTVMGKVGRPGAGYILVRLFFAHLPDRLGGRRVAFISLCIEVIGQMLLWAAPSSGIALAGAALTGLGFSLVFPSFGVEAVKQLSPQNKGVALGAYVAFFDLALGVTGPLAGFIAGHWGYAAIYAFGALAAGTAALLSLSLRTR